MSTDSVRSFSFSPSSSDDEDDMEIITSFSVAEDGDGASADPTTVLPAAPTSSSDSKIYPKKVSDKKSDGSCTVTDDPKETADSADSSGSRLNNISAVNSKEKKNNIRSNRKMRLYFSLLFLVHLITYLSLNNYHDLIVRSFVHGGPIDVRVKSFKLSTFYSTSWLSRRINVEGDMCLEVKNLLLRDHVIYDPVEVSITQKGTVLSLNTKRDVVQAPGGTSTLSLSVMISIDPYAIHEKFVTPDGIASFDVFVRANVTELKSKKWSESLLYSCSDIQLQFPRDGSVMAKMINEKPVICQYQSAADRRRIREIPGYKFNDIMKKIQGIVKVFF